MCSVRSVLLLRLYQSAESYACRLHCANLQLIVTHQCALAERVLLCQVPQVGVKLCTAHVREPQAFVSPGCTA